MKYTAFNLFSHRELPADFADRYHSVWVDAPFDELATPEQYGRFTRWSLEELLLAARLGIDGVGTNEHHQCAYGGFPSPNMIGAILAWETRDLDVAIVPMGATLSTYSPPNRIAEEYAILDSLSGGRLVAGMPVGTPMDGAQCYGIPPITQRERYYEAHDFILRAWRDPEVFAWNGRYFQLPRVNLWPRPVQKPHPPVWVPGFGSVSTWDFVTEHDHCYACLSGWGVLGGRKLLEGFWQYREAHGLDLNPYRAAFAIPVLVAESDAKAEKLYEPHLRYFFRNLFKVPAHYWSTPGYQDYTSLKANLEKIRGTNPALDTARMIDAPWGRFVDEGVLVAGSPATCIDRLTTIVKELRFGNLLVVLHWGSMDRDLTMRNIEMFCTEVLPKIRNVWPDTWENHWWPERLRTPRAAPRALGEEARP